VGESGTAAVLRETPQPRTTRASEASVAIDKNIRLFIMLES